MQSLNKQFQVDDLVSLLDGVPSLGVLIKKGRRETTIYWFYNSLSIFLYPGGYSITYAHSVNEVCCKAVEKSC